MRNARKRQQYLASRSNSVRWNNHWQELKSIERRKHEQGAS